MAELFGTSIPNVLMHIKNIYTEGELLEEATIKKFLIVQNEWNRAVSREIEYYNLDMIISVGYRVSSKQATLFRQRATQRLSEYIMKWFVIDDERLKNPDLPFDYFEELLQRIQDIRTSEKRFYRKITDIYATSIDYDPTDPMSINFFQTVQNKVHYAITQQTAAEIIQKRADATKDNMWLTNRRWPKIRKADTSIAKNYLTQEELWLLNNLVEQYLVFAEWQAMKRVPMKMLDWIEKLDGFLQLNDREVLDNAGSISHESALQHSAKEYEIYKKAQNIHIEYDEFDKEVDKYLP